MHIGDSAGNIALDAVGGLDNLKGSTDTAIFGRHGIGHFLVLGIAPFEFEQGFCWHDVV